MHSPLGRDRSTSRWFGRGRTRALLSVGLLVGIGAVGTSAYWAAGTEATGTTVQAGTIHIDLAANNGVKPETYAWAGLSLSNLAPGASRAAVLPVTNNSLGLVTFSYRIQAAATGSTLGPQLQVTVRRGGTTDGASCSGGTLVGGANATLNGFNEPAGVTLAPTQAHTICVQVTRTALALAGGSTSNVTFTFPATQVPS